MKIEIVCDICENPMPIIDVSRKKLSTTIYRVGICGHCETMAHKVRRSLLDKVNPPVRHGTGQDGV